MRKPALTRNAALLLMMVLLPTSAVMAQTASSTATPANPSQADPNLPVSLDRIRKALTVETPTAPIQATMQTEDGVPKFAVRTQAPRTLVLRSYLDDGTAVPAYVRPPFDPYHYEFLEMVTPDAIKGCAQFDESACLSNTAGQIVTGAAWQAFATNILRGMFRP